MSGFPIAALSFIQSPRSGAPLRLKEGIITDGCVEQGIVSGGEGEEFRIEHGILRLLDSALLSRVQIQEVAERDKESATYTKRLSARHFREVVPFMHRARVHETDTVLELGCGTGRITKQLAHATLVVATDFSFDSLREASRQVSSSQSIAFVEADSISFPGVSNSFSRIISAQFLEHIPTQDLRDACVRSTARMLSPTGRVVLSAYHHDIRRILRREPQEGAHSNGIFFRYFTSRDMRKLFSKYFSHVSISYADIVPPLLLRFGVGERALGLISRLCAYTPLFILAHLVVVEAEKAHTA